MPQFDKLPVQQYQWHEYHDSLDDADMHIPLAEMHAWCGRLTRTSDWHPELLEFPDIIGEQYTVWELTQSAAGLQ